MSFIKKVAFVRTFKRIEFQSRVEGTRPSKHSTSLDTHKILDITHRSIPEAYEVNFDYYGQGDLSDKKYFTSAILAARTSSEAGSTLGSARNYLCELRHITEPLGSSSPSLEKGGDESTPKRRLLPQMPALLAGH